MFSGRSHLGATAAPTPVLGLLAVITLISISSDHALATCPPSCHPQGSNVLVSCETGNEAEMSIAINPMDPMNLVIVALPPLLAPIGQPSEDRPMNTFYSCNGGTTWTPVPLDSAFDGLTNTKRRGDPTVAIDADGNVYVGYGAKLNENELPKKLIIAKSADGGQTYTSFVEVDGPDPGLDKWMVNTGPDPDDLSRQNVYVAYTHISSDKTRIELRLAASCDAGLTFPTNEIVNDALSLSMEYDSSGGMPAVDSAGRLHVVWLETDPRAGPFGDFARIKIDYSDDGGKTFNTDKLIGTTRVSPGHDNNLPTLHYGIPAQPKRGIIAFPSIAIDSSGGPLDGRIYVAYTVVKDPAPNPIDPFDTDIEVAYIHRDELTAEEEPSWTHVRVNDDTTAMSQFNPWLDVDPVTGQVVIMWLDARNDNDPNDLPINEQVEVFIGVSSDGGANWKNRRVSDGPSNVGNRPPGAATSDFLEYNGVAIYDSVVHAAWSDNSCTNQGQLDVFTVAIDLKRRFVDAAAGPGGDGIFWAAAYQFLQDALTEATVDPAISEIRVAGGTYNPDEDEGGNVLENDRSASFQLLSGLTLLGGFRGFDGSAFDPNERNLITFETTLNGDLANDDVASVLELTSGDMSRTDNSYHVVTGSGTDATAILDGFTIRGGNADGGGADADGAGLYNDQGQAIISRCIFVDNVATGDGGGMYNADSCGSSPLITPTVANCKFLKNLAGSGGGMFNNATKTLAINCVFAGNQAGLGGAIACVDASPVISNCTLFGNTAGGEAGGVYILTVADAVVDVKIDNCILWGNSDNGVIVQEAQIASFCFGNGPWDTTITVANSDIQGLGTGFLDPGITSISNIDADPVFTKPDIDDLDLRLARPEFGSSPCVDTGDNTRVAMDAADLDGDGDFSEQTPIDLEGNVRILDGDDDVWEVAVVDMGAYEYDCTCPIALSADSIKLHPHPSGLGFASRGIASGQSECRTTGGAVTLEFVFNEAVYSDDGDNFVAGDFTIQNGAVTAITFSLDRKTLTVSLNGVADAQCLDISFVVQDAYANSVAMQFGWAILLGDANDDGVVDAADRTIVIDEDGNTATSTLFRCDLDLNGTIEADEQGSQLDLDLVTVNSPPTSANCGS